MDISYLGHSCFKLKGKQGIVVTDPYDDSVGFKLSSVSADIVTVSHQHGDHNAIAKVTGTVRREKAFIVDAPGEYEVGGISVFGYPSYHDAKQGAERGMNIMYTIQLDDVVVAHLGDLGHALDEKTVEALGQVDVLICPVGGGHTIDPKVAMEVIQSIEPSYVIPMHYRTPQHDEKMFSGLATVEDFMKIYGVTKEAVPSFSVTATTMPEETELVILKTA